MKYIFLFLCLLLSACSNMDPKECANANWQSIGYNDAIQGRTVWLTSRTEACAKVSIVPNRKAYLAGHQAGSKKFCTFKNGFLFGRRGNESIYICKAPELAKPFYDGFKQGLEVYREEQDLREIMYELQQRLNDISRLHHYKS